MNRWVESCTLYFLSWEIILMKHIVISVKINLSLIELLFAQNLLYCGNEIVKHFGLCSWGVNIHHKNEGVFWWRLHIHTSLMKSLLLSSQNVIWRLGSLNTFSINLIIAHKTILSTTYKTNKTVFLYLVVVIHVSSARGTTWNLVNRFLNRIHVVWYGWDDHTDRHFETIIKGCSVRHVSVWITVSTGVVLRIICIFLELLL